MFSGNNPSSSSGAPITGIGMASNQMTAAAKAGGGGVCGTGPGQEPSLDALDQNVKLVAQAINHLTDAFRTLFE